jgi:hypothetical protein
MSGRTYRASRAGAIDFYCISFLSPNIVSGSPLCSHIESLLPEPSLQQVRHRKAPCMLRRGLDLIETDWRCFGKEVDQPVRSEGSEPTLAKLGMDLWRR